MKFLLFFQKHGLVIIPDGTPNGDVNHEPVVGTIAVVSQEAAQVLESAGEGPLGKNILNTCCLSKILLDFLFSPSVHIQNCDFRATQRYFPYL